MARDEDKRMAATHAAELIQDGMVVGLGTGSTAKHFVDILGERVKKGLRMRGIPTSSRTRAQAESLGIPLTSFAEVTRIDVTVDGADEFDGKLNLLKGGGGALLHEKIVAAASDRMVVIADAEKEVEHLGKFPLPVEVIPLGWQVVARKLEALSAHPKLRPGADGKPYVTDEGNHILDCHYGRIDDPERTAAQIRAIVGVVEHGLFLGMAEQVIVAASGRVQLKTRS